MKQVRHWQDYLNIALGVWLIASPLVLGFETQSVATWNNVVVGLLLLAAALGAVFLPMAWEDWSEMALGGWLVISPLFLNFDSQIGAANSLISGLLVLTLALWALEDQDIASGHPGPTSL